MHSTLLVLLALGGGYYAYKNCSTINPLPKNIVLTHDEDVALVINLLPVPLPPNQPPPPVKIPELQTYRGKTYARW